MLLRVVFFILPFLAGVTGAGVYVAGPGRRSSVQGIMGVAFNAFSAMSVACLVFLVCLAHFYESDAECGKMFKDNCGSFSLGLMAVFVLASIALLQDFGILSQP